MVYLYKIKLKIFVRKDPSRPLPPHPEQISLKYSITRAFIGTNISYYYVKDDTSECTYRSAQAAETTFDVNIVVVVLARLPFPCTTLLPQIRTNCQFFRTFYHPVVPRPQCQTQVVVTNNVMSSSMYTYLHVYVALEIDHTHTRTYVMRLKPGLHENGIHYITMGELLERVTNFYTQPAES